MVYVINTKEHYNYLLNKNLLNAFRMFLYKTKKYDGKEEMIFNLGYTLRYLEEITKIDRGNLREPDPTNINTTIQDIASFLKDRMEKETARKALDYVNKQRSMIKDPSDYYKYAKLFVENLEMKVDKYETERLLENGITAYNLKHYTEDFVYLIKYYIDDNKKADRIITILNVSNNYRYTLMKQWEEKDRKEKREKEMKKYEEILKIKD